MQNSFAISSTLQQIFFVEFSQNCHFSFMHTVIKLHQWLGLSFKDN